MTKDTRATGPVPPRHNLRLEPVFEDARTRARPTERLRSARHNETTPLTKGTLLGRYVVLEPLGEGGFGAVYTAYDPKLDRRVALKLLRGTRGVDDPDLEFGARLLREAQALASLSHPNIVNVHDVGTHNGRVFMAMERVDGTTLQIWLGQQDRSWRQVRDVMVGAAEGLAAAHVAGIVHRDFKPLNVLIDGTGRARVVDFGLARRVDVNVQARARASDIGGSSSLLAQQVTVDGVVLGTPAFMAPEQFTHNGADASCDQFAFCVTLYLALLGVRPFRATSHEMLVTEVRKGIGDAPPRNTMPRWLWRALARGLSHDADQRFAGMPDLVHALVHDRRRRRLGWTAIGLSVAISSALTGGVMLALKDPHEASVVGVVETLTVQARAAAAKSYFVYPPSDDATTPTAFVRVVEIEALGTDPALARAQELRAEFAETLVRLGDEYWDRDGGRIFAADYYAGALVFDDDHEQARRRTFMTPVQLQRLEHKAANLLFDVTELRAADILAALSVPGQQQRRDRIRALHDTTHALPTLTVTTQLERVLGEPIGGAPPLANVADPRVSDETPPVGTPTPEVSPKSEDNEATDSVASSADVRRNRGAAAKAAKAGRAAFAAGRWREAERRFHAALEHNPRSLGALEGLTHLSFEKGAYNDAVKFAQLAVRVASKRGRARIALGDALLKTLRYAEARVQYERALALRDPRAKARLQRLDNKVGH